MLIIIPYNTDYTLSTCDCIIQKVIVIKTDKIKFTSKVICSLQKLELLVILIFHLMW